MCVWLVLPYVHLRNVLSPFFPLCNSMTTLREKSQSHWENSANTPKGVVTEIALISWSLIPDPKSFWTLQVKFNSRIAFSTNLSLTLNNLKSLQILYPSRSSFYLSPIKDNCPKKILSVIFKVKKGKLSNMI